MNSEPYICFAGVELVNSLRTLSYLRKGLAGSKWEVDVEDNVAEGNGYVDVYEDYGYSPDPFWPGNLACYCAAMDTSADSDGWVDPATDDAPWYDARFPASAEFYGLHADVRILSAISRTSAPRGDRAGTLMGPLTLGTRIVQVTATMVASTARGMQWGERWVCEVLAGSYCPAGAVPDVATVLPACPDTDIDDAGFRDLVDVGVVSGPTFAPIRLLPDCALQTVSFQLGAGQPWLFAPPVECDTATLTAGQTLACDIDNDEWGGDVAAVIEVTASTAIDGLVVEAFPLPDDAACPAVGTPSPCASYTIGLDEGDVLTLDSSRGTLTVADATSKAVREGWGDVDFTGAPGWLVAGPCARLCVQVRHEGTGVAAVVITTVRREL